MSVVILDDRLLIEELADGLPRPRPPGGFATTSYWYYRACRAARLSSGGQLSGPIERLSPARQSALVQSFMELPPRIALPDPRRTVPAMVGLSERHPRLNVLNLEAVALAQDQEASIWLCERGARGVLAAVLDAESIGWLVIPLP